MPRRRRRKSAPNKIPAQNLAAALDVYATISGLQVLYESSLVSGRLSSPVDGMLTSGAALQNLLAGTGLSGRMTDVDAVTISVKPEEHAHVPSGPELQFVAGIQSGITAALCQRVETRPRNFRAAVQLWIAEYGVVRRVSVLGSTGDFRRDDAIAQALQHLDLGMRPPPGLPQPLTLAILPLRLDQGLACEDR